MAALDRLHPEQSIEALNVPQTVHYNWEYDATRRRLMRLYENAKRDQWNASERLDWSVDVDPRAGLVPDLSIGIYGTPMWDRLTPSEIERLRHEAITWQLCQFLHGEQGALLVTAQVVDSVPWYEAKQYGATQVMDEARHVEVYRRFVQEKLEHEYPVNPELKKLLDQILSDSRWDMKFLGMQIIVEGLALAAFGTIRDTATNPLLRDLTAAVMEDESRHVAFGVLSLREYCADLTEAERHEREDFVYEACVLMRDRLTNREVWEAMGMDADACVAAFERSELHRQFRYRLFSKIVPNVKSLGLLSDRQRERFEALGILQYENNTSSDVDQEIEEERRLRAEGMAA
ncbi:MAG: ferritin-like domain-containing protein [Deltaproteobacteria bacterium]|nr:MAG: ferritin-like domain-containing protein [Deltaproteobacteria bacterium]